MRIFFLLMLFLPCTLSAQVEDHFDDGDFTQNPSWMGDVSHFKVSSSSAIPENQRPALQLDAPQAGQSCLAVASTSTGAMEWRFWIKLSMNTSAGNFARVYLCSDQEDLKSPLNGYFVQLGGVADSVGFFRQDSLETIWLLNLDTLYTGNSTNAIRMRVIRETDGAWHFHADPSGGQSMIKTGSFSDTTSVNPGFFGFFCQYTSSNTTKFYFDDIYAGPVVIDTVAPELINLEIQGPNEIRLFFSEPVSETSAGTIQNFDLQPGIGHPYEAIRLLEPDQVHLFFDPGMESGNSYTLSIGNIEDHSGNILQEGQWPVIYYEPRPWDVIITEIMADPSPVVSLPEYEYLEIHNRCPHTLNLSGWKLTVGSSVYVLPSLIMEPDSYALITGPEGAIAFVNHGNVTALGSFSLPNGGAAIRLAEPHGGTISALHYQPSWYRDNAKADGGWSLEMSDISNPCKDDNNWKASQHPAGGTPGRANLFPLISEEELFIAGIRIASPSSLEVIFSQVPDSLCATHFSHYSINPPVLQVLQASTLAPASPAVELDFDGPIPEGEIFSVIVSENLCNCILIPAGRDIPGQFALPDKPDTADLVINEILFNPIGDGVDYVEIYNLSGKTIDLSGLSLASLNETPPNPPDTNRGSLARNGYFMLPDSYLVLTEDPEMVMRQFVCENPRNISEMPGLPAFNNDQGCALLLDSSGRIIDGMVYREDMHHPLLNSFDGVSLERISASRSGYDVENWYSAAETAGFGTPGYRNSQWINTWDAESSFSVNPELFSPDGDGKDDHLGIQYNFTTPGKLLNILIFNASGNMARNLVNCGFPATSGIYTWDGLLDDRTPAPDGIYIILAEALDMEGRMHRQKMACVVARRR